MDPNETLKRLREAAEWQLNQDGTQTRMEIIDNADNMAEAFQALDQWLSKGEFRPTAWIPTKYLRKV